MLVQIYCQKQKVHFTFYALIKKFSRVARVESAFGLSENTISNRVFRV